MGGLADVIAEISELAGEQLGFITAAQAAKFGVTRVHPSRLADQGVLNRIEQGLYEYLVPDKLSRNSKAVWLMLNPKLTVEERLRSLFTSGVVSHQSAAALQGLGDSPNGIPSF